MALRGKSATDWPWAFSPWQNRICTTSIVPLCGQMTLISLWAWMITSLDLPHEEADNPEKCDQSVVNGASGIWDQGECNACYQAGRQQRDPRHPCLVCLAEDSWRPLVPRHEQRDSIGRDETHKEEFPALMTARTMTALTIEAPA